jgi:precorrin-6B methylase 2
MRRFTLLALTLLSASAVSFAQQFKNPDNLGPDVPTPQTIVEQMLRMAKIRPGETVYDLGCGDGRILITAAQQFNAKAVGIEMSRDIFESTSARIKSMGLDDRVRIIHGNALHVDLTPADVVTLYLLTSSNERLKPILERQLKAGARVVSHDYEIRGWKPLDVSRMTAMGRTHAIYVYQLPQN